MIIENGNKSLFLIFFLLCSTHFIYSTDRIDRQILIDSAVEKNKELLILESQSRQAEITVQSARSRFLPDLSFSSDLAYLSTPDSYTIKAGDFFNGALPGIGNFLLPDEDYTVELGQNTRYEFSLLLEQPIFTWGKLSGALDAARLSQSGSILKIEAKTNEVVTQLDIILYSLTCLMEIKNESMNQISASRELVRISRENYENGFLLYSDLLAVQLQAGETELAGSIIDEQINQALLGIELLCGLEELSVDRIQLPQKRSWNGFLSEEKDLLVARAQRKNLNLRLFDLEIQGREIAEDIARGSGYLKPDIGIYAKLSYSASAFPLLQHGWTNSDSLSFIAALGIRTLIYDGGERSGEINTSMENLNQAVLKRERNSELIKEFIIKSLFQMELSLQKIEYYQLQIETDLAGIEQKTEEWQAGLGEERDVLIERILLHSHRMARLEEEIVMLKNHFQIKNILGERD